MKLPMSHPQTIDLGSREVGHGGDCCRAAGCLEDQKAQAVRIAHVRRRQLVDVAVDQGRSGTWRDADHQTAQSALDTAACTTPPTIMELLPNNDLLRPYLSLKWQQYSEPTMAPKFQAFTANVHSSFE
jgi:hypothetical protein